MIIGIDAYCLYEKYNTGIGTLNLNLLLALSKIKSSHQYILFTPSVYHKDAANEIIQNKNFQIVEIISMFHKRRRLWLQSLSMRREIIKENIEVFFGVGEYLPIFLPQKIKCVVTIHDMVFAIYPNTITLMNKISYKTLFQLSVRRADVIISVSENSKREILEYLSIKKPIHVIYNGIDLSKYAPPKINKKENYILFVGTLQPRKNLINVLKAFKIISCNTNIDLYIVGAAGWKNHAIRHEFEKLDESVQQKIKFLGYVDDKMLIKLYQNAKVFCAPSLHEGFGLIILEALASGTPVVTSNRGAIAEIFKDSVEYADPLSPEDIAQKILEILHNEKKQKHMIDYGMRFAKKFDISITAQQYVKVFEQLGQSNKTITNT